MAKIPTTDEIIEEIYDEIRLSGVNPRPNEFAFRLVTMQIALDKKGIRADEFNQALHKLVESGEFEPGNIGMMITEKGFSRL